MSEIIETDEFQSIQESNYKLIQVCWSSDTMKRKISSLPPLTNTSNPSLASIQKFQGGPTESGFPLTKR